MQENKKFDTRPPIIAVLGHVDHGKTTLLDTIRKTNVVAREHGGITQHIGAYQTNFQGKLITFIDTPGHAAFEKMRSRGAKVADIAVLVVAANDSVKPQTKEAINHIKKAQIPVVVAITKVDLENINIEKVKRDLQKEDIVAESFGGDVPIVEVAAPKNKGISELLEVVQLVWQISPQPSLKDDFLEAVVVESFLDKNRGPIVSVIIKKGIIKLGEVIEVDGEKVKVKALIDDRGKNVKLAEPAKPVEILGFKRVLEVGSIVKDFIKTERENLEKEVATHADIIAKGQEIKGKFKVIIKADVLGSLEAIKANLPEKILVLDSKVGEVQSTDVNFAKTAKAPVLAFNVKISNSVKKQADREHVVIKEYKVIYELIADMQDISESFEQTKHELKVKGKANIVAVFDIDSKKIAGVKVVSGKIRVGDKVVVKDQKGKSQETEVVSLKKFKKGVESVSAGQECGIGFSSELDFQESYVIESLG